MDYSLKYKEWLDKSARDLKSAKILKYNDCGNDIVAFHCQQCIEKALKGFLLRKLGYVVEGHSLIYLCKEASKEKDTLKKYLKDCVFVNQYYIETRYPADIPLIVTNEEADECIDISEKIYNIAINNL